MNNSIEIYRSQDGSVQLNVKLENETVWLSANQMECFLIAMQRLYASI